MHNTLPFIKVKKPDDKKSIIEIEKLISKLTENTYIKIGR